MDKPDLTRLSEPELLRLHGSILAELCRRGVCRTNNTPMLLGTFEHAAPGDPQSVEAMFAGAVPLGRIGDPSEAAAAIVWLASDAASYVVGHSLIADGGLTAPYRWQFEPPRRRRRPARRNLRVKPRLPGSEKEQTSCERDPSRLQLSLS